LSSGGRRESVAKTNVLHPQKKCVRDVMLLIFTWEEDPDLVRCYIVVWEREREGEEGKSYEEFDARFPDFRC